MGTKYLLDSNVIIGYLDNKITQSGITFVSAVINKVPNVSVISKIEVLRFNTTETATEVLRSFFNYAVVYQLDNSVVEKTIDICRNYRIKLPDAIIAATCIINNFVLLTRNVADFKNIENLKMINPWEL